MVGPIFAEYSRYKKLLFFPARKWRGDAMVRDGVANMVIRLQESGFDPRKAGPDSWESRCPAHRSADCALSITRNEHNHVVLECRSTQNH